MAPARTRTTDALGAAGDGDFGSAAQRERRKRILDATLALASRGGYDAVQMRTVAERADVALGTLYRYFPSKIHLLVSALVRGSYHLYQGIGGGIGNVLLGLVFGRVWQRTGRLWALVGAHTLIDVVAFLGYALLAGHLSWLP